MSFDGGRALSAAVQIISVSARHLLSANYFEYALLMAADEDYDTLDERNKLKPLLHLPRDRRVRVHGGIRTYGRAAVEGLAQ